MTRPNLDDADPGRLECGNCGETENLLRCSRCRTAWYCCRACQKSHWPFHREDCRSNAFADAVEESEPKFASWLRRHGKQAALRDGDVERLEHASQAACSPISRRELMDSMWGKADPSPAAPRWTREDEERMAAAVGRRLLEKEREEQQEGRGMGPAARAALRAWTGCAMALPPPVEQQLLPEGEEGKDGGEEKRRQQQQHQHPLGRESGSLWRWWQTPTRVEVVVNLFEVRRELRRRERRRERREDASSSSSSSSPAASSSPLSSAAAMPSLSTTLAPRRKKKGGGGGQQQHRRVDVSIGPQTLSISLLPAVKVGSSGGEKGEKEEEEEKRVDLLLSGPLFKRVAVEGSTWHVSDGVLLHVSLLKLSRRGGYVGGDTAAETWWRSVFSEEEEREGEGERENELGEVGGGKALPRASSSSSHSLSPSSFFLELPEPLPASAPLCYYALPRDPDDEGPERVVTRKKK